MNASWQSSWDKIPPSEVILAPLQNVPRTRSNRFPFTSKLDETWSKWQFSFDFKPNRIIFVSKSKLKQSLRSYSIEFERKWKSIFFSEKRWRAVLWNVPTPVILCSFFDYKNNSDQTRSCPRDWCLSASWGTYWGSPMKPDVNHSTIVLRGLMGPLIGPP